MYKLYTVQGTEPVQQQTNPNESCIFLVDGGSRMLPRLKHWNNHFCPYERCVNKRNLSKETISNNQHL